MIASSTVACTAALVVGVAVCVPLVGQQPAVGCDAAGAASLWETVLDRMTEVPLRGANVTVSWRDASGDRQVSARTDSAGRAFFCIPAQVEIVIRAEYQNASGPQHRTVLVATNSNAHTSAIDVPYVNIRGQVVDHATDEPVANAAVFVTHTGLRTLTRSDGTFMLPRVPIGDYALRIEHLSYATTSAPLKALYDDLRATVRLTPEAIPLAAIVVTTFSQRLERSGFYDREKHGIGTFITRKQIDAARLFNTSDLLRSVAGLRQITTQARRGVASRNLTMGRGNCQYRYVVDGTRTLPDFDIDNVAPVHIEGIEVYSGTARVPAAFRMQDTGVPACGVIVVWTRDGR
jgi:hypothetical protein